MKIKYELKHTFEKITCMTPCPNGYENVMVQSNSCSKCNFYKKKKTFKQEIICTYDKYYKPIPIIEESVTEVKYISKEEEVDQAIESIMAEIKKPGIVGN